MRLSLLWLRISQRKGKRAKQNTQKQTMDPQKESQRMRERRRGMRRKILMEKRRKKVCMERMKGVNGGLGSAMVMKNKHDSTVITYKRKVFRI